MSWFNVITNPVSGLVKKISTGAVAFGGLAGKDLGSVDQAISASAASTEKGITNAGNSVLHDANMGGVALGGLSASITKGASGLGGSIMNDVSSVESDLAKLNPLGFLGNLKKYAEYALLGVIVLVIIIAAAKHRGTRKVTGYGRQ